MYTPQQQTIIIKTSSLHRLQDQKKIGDTINFGFVFYNTKKQNCILKVLEMKRASNNWPWFSPAGRVSEPWNVTLTRLYLIDSIVRPICRCLSTQHIISQTNHSLDIL